MNEDLMKLLHVDEKLKVFLQSLLIGRIFEMEKVDSFLFKVKLQRLHEEINIIYKIKWFIRKNLFVSTAHYFWKSLQKIEVCPKIHFLALKLMKLCFWKIGLNFTGNWNFSCFSSHCRKVNWSIRTLSLLLSWFTNLF